MNTTTADLLTDAVVAPVAGYAATKVMEPVSMKLYQLEPDETRRREDAARPGFPSQIAAERHDPDTPEIRHGMILSVWRVVYGARAVVVCSSRLPSIRTTVAGRGAVPSGRPWC
ncbi:hypothetical protein ACFTXK_00035 [Streptomyces sp. NPDC056956]|uniref:hypothetical protein n=1 Tax=Streptomyces sp. NPDC056956 TaxID=3345980 RepID=UPI00363A17DF